MTLELSALGLRDLTSCGGCAAKADSALVHLLRQSALGATQPGTVIGLDVPDDASILEINETTSLITTVDFFPPVVRDSYTYGYISALNSLSDVFAMGGTARAALLICGFPIEMPEEEMVACVAGARDACAQSGAEIIGGHTVRVAEAVFGMSVIGYVHPDQIWRKTGMREGDVLMISKPLGTGVLLATRNLEDELAAIEIMKLSNL
jgi:selenide,water dikinase